MTSEEVMAGVECLLFVSGAPLAAKEMALALECSEAEVTSAAGALTERAKDYSGLQVKAVAGGWQMVTRPEYALAVARFVGKRSQKLSKAALETLAIVAYNQPCTMPEIEAIRGVDCSGVLKSLQEKGLVEEAGRKEGPGRPILFGTTQEFLIYFGLNTLSDLPDASEFEASLPDPVQPQLPEVERSAGDSGDDAVDISAMIPAITVEASMPENPD